MSAPGKTVTVLGGINMDVVLQVSRFPRGGETIIAADVTRHPGGKGANQAVAAARAGASVTMIGAVGMDDDGRALLSQLQAEDIDCNAVGTVPDLPTGTAYVIVDETGENQIIVAAGANATRPDDTEVGDGVLLAQLELSLDAVEAFLSARRSGSIAILNAAPFHPQGRRLMALADIVVVNEIELASYCEREPPQNSHQASDMAQTLLSETGQIIIVTRGSAGSITVSWEGMSEAAGVAARAVDTTSAGDCFCGFVAAGLAAGQTLADAVDRGHQAAAIAVSRWGAIASIPRLAELRSV